MRYDELDVLQLALGKVEPPTRRDLTSTVGRTFSSAISNASKGSLPVRSASLSNAP